MKGERTAKRKYTDTSYIVRLHVADPIVITYTCVYRNVLHAICIHFFRPLIIWIRSFCKHQTQQQQQLLTFRGWANASLFLLLFTLFQIQAWFALSPCFHWYRLLVVSSIPPSRTSISIDAAIFHNIYKMRTQRHNPYDIIFVVVYNNRARAHYITVSQTHSNHRRTHTHRHTPNPKANAKKIIG